MKIGGLGAMGYQDYDNVRGMSQDKLKFWE